jgi:hypothetical protein
MKSKRYRLAALIVFCILAGGLFAYGYRVLLSSEQKEGHEPTPGKFLPKLAKVRTHLYFLDEHHRFLKAEERTMSRQDSVVEHARSIVHALIKGPEGELLPTVPTEAKLLSLFVTEDSIAYVDFDSAIKASWGWLVRAVYDIFRCKHFGPQYPRGRRCKDPD